MMKQNKKPLFFLYQRFVVLKSQLHNERTSTVRYAGTGT